MKKALSLILSIVMLLTFVFSTSINVFAVYELNPYGECGDNATYTFDESTGELKINGTGSFGGFGGFSEIKSVVIGNSITEIEYQCFNECKNLESVTIGTGVKKIGYHAFDGSGLASVNIPSSVSVIEWSAFLNCSSLETVTINGTNEIDNYVFSGCSSLENITLGEGIKTIGDGCFEDCYSLETIKLPNSLVEIDNSAFNGCNNLKNVTFGTGLKTIPDSMFNGFKNLTSVTIPNGVKKIGYHAFDGSGLTSVNIPSSVSVIEWSAFQNCADLKTAIVNGTNEIDNYVFSGCSSLENVTIGEGTKTIGDGCFEDCTSLKEVNLPSSISEISSGAFSGDSNVVINYTGTANQWNNIDKDNTISNSTVVSTKTGVAGNKAVGKVTLSKTAFTYNKKINKPSVKVTDKEGNPLSSKYYNVIYPSGMKNVGTYSVKITFKDVYAKTAAKTLTYKINPKGTTVSKVTAKKKAAVVKWKKQAAQTTGYEIQYGLKKNFKGAKVKTVKKNKTTKLTIKKLKSKKKYYVRIRTYKTVGGKKYYSSWSKSKRVKVK